MTTPTRTEFEAAAYRWLRDNCHPENLRKLYNHGDGKAVLATAMGWPTVPEVKS